MADAAPDTTDLEPLYRQMLAQTLAPQAAPQPQGPTASSHEGRGWLSLLGEALGGGQEYGTTAEREGGGIRALGAMGARMLAASDYSYQPHTLGSIIGQGMGAAGESLGQTGSVAASRAAALQDYQEKQQQLQLARVKEAVPLLTALQTLQQQKRLAGIGSSIGGTPGTTPGTSIGAAGDDLTGDKAHDLPLIAKRESGGDATALNYVAKADPTAYDRGATASGKYQIVNSTWREGMQLAGIDPSKYATARAAPESVQDQVASALFDKYGNKPWQKGATDWVKGGDGRYTLQTVKPPAGAPGSPTAPPGSTATATPPPASAVAADGKPVGDPTKPELAPGPPGSTGGTPTSLGAAVAALSAGKPQYTVAPPPQIRAQPIPAGRTAEIDPSAVQGNVAAIEEGRQRALASMQQPDGSVLAAGPAAPTGGFTAGAGSYGTTTTPPAVAAPQAPPQAQQPPAPPPAVVTAPAPGGPSAPFVVPEPPQQVRDTFATVLKPEEEAEFQHRFADAQRQFQIAQASANPKGMEDAQKEISAVRQAQIDARVKRYELGTKAQQDWNSAALTAHNKNIEQQQAFDQQSRLKEIEGQQTRLTNKEAVFNQANQKGLEAAQTEQLAARNSVAQLEGFRSVSDAVKQPNWLQTTKWPGSTHSIAEQLQQAGVPVEDTAGVQLLQGAMTNLTRTLREGMPMGALSDRDLDFIQRMGPTEWMDKDTRTAAVDYLQRAFRAKMRFASDVQKEMSRGKNYGDAVDAADAKQPKSFVPAVDAELSSHWKDNGQEWVDRRIKWAQDNDVRPGTLFHMNNGNIVIWKSKPNQGQQ